jgi:hypothetical protein
VLVFRSLQGANRSRYSTAYQQTCHGLVNDPD